VADAEIGQPERARGDTAARQVDRLEPGALREDAMISADDAGHLQRPLRGDGRAEASAGRRCGHPASSEATPARSSSSSFSVAFILSREKSSIVRSRTRVYSPAAV